MCRPWAGDSTDNVPGVPGIGVKTAAQLIHEYGDLDTLLQRASEIKQAKRRENLVVHADKARLSRELVRLRDDVSAPIPLENLVRREPNQEALLNFLKEQGFRSIMARIQSRVQSQGQGISSLRYTGAADRDPLGDTNSSI